MRIRALIPLFAVALAGCSTAPSAPDFVDAKGKVTLGGKPVSKAYVGFIPTGAQQEVYAKVENGEFTARVMTGKYHIVVEPEWKRMALAPKASEIPARFMDAKTSKLEADVPAGGRADLEFKLD
jgi:hypothetical protein